MVIWNLDHVSHLPAVREEQALSLPLSKDIWWPQSQTKGANWVASQKDREQEGFAIIQHLSYTAEEGKFVTYRVTPFLALCADERGGNHSTGSYGPKGVRGSHAGGEKICVGRLVYLKANCSLLCQVCLTHMCTHTE